MQWLLEPEVFKGDLNLFIETLDRFNIKYTLCQFGKSYEEHIAEMEGEDIFFQGSLQFAKRIKTLANRKGLYCNLDKLDCTYYYPKFGDYLLNNNFSFLPFGNLESNFAWLDNQLFNDNGAFVRPTKADKAFTGMIFTKSNLEDQIKKLKFKMNPEDLVLISQKLDNITKEWRLIVIDNKVVAGSQYKQNGKNVRFNDVPIEVYKFADEVLSKVKYAPDRAWTLDICELYNFTKYLKVVEVGSFSCSGLYAADPVVIIEALRG